MHLNDFIHKHIAVNKEYPKPNDHKYSRGGVLLITGSNQYPGAGLLTVEAALRSGAGIVYFLSDPLVMQMAVTKYPEVVIVQNSDDLSNVVTKIRSIVVGSGVNSQYNNSQQLKNIEDTISLCKGIFDNLSWVIDAGGLEILNKYQNVLSNNIVLTPNDFEYQKYLIDDNVSLKNYLIIHKNHQTNVSEYQTSIKNKSITMNRWLSTAGTGDVLAGLLGSLMAIGKFDSLSLSAKESFLFDALKLYNSASIRASSKGSKSGGIPIIASDIIKHLNA